MHYNQITFVQALVFAHMHQPYLLQANSLVTLFTYGG